MKDSVYNYNSVQGTPSKKLHVCTYEKDTQQNTYQSEKNEGQKEEAKKLSSLKDIDPNKNPMTEEVPKKRPGCVDLG